MRLLTIGLCFLLYGCVNTYPVFHVYLEADVETVPSVSEDEAVLVKAYPICFLTKCDTSDSLCANKILKLVNSLDGGLWELTLKKPDHVISNGKQFYFTNLQVKSELVSQLDENWADIGCIWDPELESPIEPTIRRCKSLMSKWVKITRIQGISTLRNNQDFKRHCLREA